MRRSEMDEELPQEGAMGHRMFAVGLRPLQYFYCEACSAYTGSRIQKLAMQCQPCATRVRAVENLKLGLHPTDGTQLATLPRRMTKKDAGYSWCGMGCPDATYEAYMLEGHDAGHPSGLSHRSPTVSSPPHTFDEDPFGHGYSLG